MTNQLSETEIRSRLQRGRNYERLYRELKARFDTLEAEHKQCPGRLTELQAKLDTQAIQIAELQAMVFGKKKRRPRSGTPIPASPALPRDAASYRRRVPPPEAVTAEVAVPLPPNCPHCGADAWQAEDTVERYEEDIPLPELTPGYQPHLVTKYLVRRGVCRSCGQTTAGRDLSVPRFPSARTSGCWSPTWCPGQG